MLQKSLILILMLFPIFMNAQTWTKLEGISAYVNAILVNDNSGNFYVASDVIPTDLQLDNIVFPTFGVGQNGFRIGKNMTADFSDEILKDYSVFALFSFPENKNIILAAIRQFNDGGVVISTDGGTTWDLNQIHCITSSQILRFASNGINSSTLFASEVNSSKGYIFTKDSFNLCETDDQFVINARDIKVSPFDTNLIFIGGNKSLRHFYFSKDKGKTWIGDESGLDGLRILCIQPSKWNAGVIYAGTDSLDYNKVSHGTGIYQSLDTGKTWHFVGAKNKRVFDMSQHPTNPKYMAAACDSGSVFFSGSYGYEWEEYSSGIPKEASVRTIALTSWGGDNAAVALAGTYGYGLYKSSAVITGQPDATEGEISVSASPQPFNELLNITFDSKGNEQLEIEIADMLGRKIYKGNFETTEKYFNFQIKTIDFVPGVYFLMIRSGKTNLTKKLIKQ